MKTADMPPLDVLSGEPPVRLVRRRVTGDVHGWITPRRRKRRLWKKLAKRGFSRRSGGPANLSYQPQHDFLVWRDAGRALAAMDSMRRIYLPARDVVIDGGEVRSLRPGEPNYASGEGRDSHYSYLEFDSVVPVRLTDPLCHRIEVGQKTRHIRMFRCQWIAPDRLTDFAGATFVLTVHTHIPASPSPLERSLERALEDRIEASMEEFGAGLLRVEFYQGRNAVLARQTCYRSRRVL